MRWVTKALIERVDWSSIDTAVGNAIEVPGALSSLFDARSEEAAKSAYWAHLDNEVVVQGSLYEAAAYIIPPILVELTSSDLSVAARYRSVELLVEIALGNSSSSHESGQGLREECIRALRQGMWTLYGLLECDDVRVVVDVIDILEVVETERARLIEIASNLIPSDSPIVENRVRELLGS